VTEPGYRAVSNCTGASSVTDNFGNRDNRRAEERRSKRKSGSSLFLWGRGDTQAMPIVSVTEVIEVTGYRLWRGCSARQTLPPPQRALAAIPKRLLVICTPPEARGSLLRDCNHLWRVGGALHRETGANKGSICRYNMLDSVLKASPLRTRERGPFNQMCGWGFLRTSPYKSSANFAFTEFSEVRRSKRPIGPSHKAARFP
jgi:hypothetical protein